MALPPTLPTSSPVSDSPPASPGRPPPLGSAASADRKETPIGREVRRMAHSDRIFHPPSPYVPYSDDDDVQRYLDFSEQPQTLPLSPPLSETRESWEFDPLMEPPRPSTTDDELSNAMHDLSFREIGEAVVGENEAVRTGDGLNEYVNFGKVEVGVPVTNLWTNDPENFVGFQALLCEPDDDEEELGLRSEQYGSDGMPNCMPLDVNGITVQGNVDRGINLNEVDAHASPEQTIYEALDPAPTPLPLQLLQCDGCQVLREMLLKNGYLTTKISIHGGLRVFHHAVFDVEYDIEGHQPGLDHYFIDFSDKTEEWIRNFLTHYNIISTQEGTVVQYDTLSAFYDILCTGMQIKVPEISLLGATPPPQGHMPTESPEPIPLNLPPLPAKNSYKGSAGSYKYCSHDHEAGPSRTGTTRGKRHSREHWPSLAEQRERTKKIDLGEIADLFHLPIVRAARELRICSTALKHVCRRCGVARWPFRKVKSIDRIITNLEEQMEFKTGSERKRMRLQLEKLHAARERIRAGQAPEDE